MKAKTKQKIATFMMALGFLSLGGVEGGVVAGNLTIWQGVIGFFVCIGFIFLFPLWADNAAERENQEEERRQRRIDFKTELAEFAEMEKGE